jgi:hypothetical protein
MKLSVFLSFLLVSMVFNNTLSAQTFKSSNSKTQLLELFSSQGCSSCPPAERWISTYTNHPGLWTQFIPLVFHVDYWDYLGWKDTFSRKQFSQRQRKYYSQGAVASVYTPGVILNGKEWRGWYRGKMLPQNSSNAGVLVAQLLENHLQVKYDHESPLVLNVALLGFGIKTKIRDGENEGHLFQEDFIVLDKVSHFSKNATWSLSIKTDSEFKAQRYAIAIWVNTADSMQPLQATGGWITP